MKQLHQHPLKQELTNKLIAAKAFWSYAMPADLLAIAAMKMEVLMRRAAFRDYYDIYSLLKQGVDLGEAVQLALKYSKHQMKRKNLLAILCNGNRFLKSDDFQLLLPVYDVTADEIAAYMSDKINSTFITPPALP